MPIRYDRFELGENDDGRRLDRIIKKVAPGVPIGRVHRALRSREIRINGKRAKADDRPSAGDVLEIAAHLTGGKIEIDERVPEPSGSNRPLSPERILLETPDIIAINKQAGELSHGPGSLEDAVREHLAKRPSRTGVSFTPGPIHRLDRNTSGIILFAASLRGAQKGTDAIREGRLKKTYLGLVARNGDSQGFVGARSGVWDARLYRDETNRVTVVRHDGLAARTEYEVIRIAADAESALLRFQLVTGRTHQIRAHARHAGWPLLGDRKYGGLVRGPYQLHAATLETDADLGFTTLSAPVPEEFAIRAREALGSDVSGFLLNEETG